MSNSTGCLVVAGPSGAGKSTIIREAMATNHNWIFSVSSTTRKLREGEIEGADYYFQDREQFELDINSGKFLEYAEVYGNLYGTLKSELDRAANEGKHLIIEVDTVGCLSIRAALPEIQLVAVLPPSIEVLSQRLKDRGTESEESLKKRLFAALAEMQRMQAFDYVVVNDGKDQAISDLLVIMQVVELGLHCVRHQVNSIMTGAGVSNAR